MVDFRINVVVDPSRVPSGTRTVERELTRVENRSNLLRTSLARTFGLLAGGALITGAIRSLANFELSIATAGAVTKATEQQFAALSARAQELGANTRFTANEAADALVNLARAGFSVNEAIEAVDDTLKLAQAGNLGLAEATDIAASTLRGFRLGVEESARVTDVLVETANNANTNVSQLGEGIKFVAPIAASLGRSLEQTSAALGVLSDAGLKASLAGTGLRRVFAELAAPGDKLRGILDAAGLTIEDVNPKTNDLVTVLERLRETGIDTGEALEVFGQRGGPAFEVLVNQIPRLQQLTGIVENAGGATDEFAKKIEGTLFEAIRRAGSAIQALVLALGEAGTSGALIAVFDGIAASFRFLADNAELVQAALIGLAAGGVAKFAAAMLTQAIPAVRAFVLSLVLARGNILAVTVEWLRLNAALAVGPFVAVAAAIAAATVSLQFQAKVLKEIEQSYKNLEEDAKFAQIGTQIRLANQELRLLQKQVAAGEQRGFGASDSQLARIEELKNRIADLNGEAREQARAAREVQEAQAANGVTVENTIKRLEREAAALQNVSRETENRTRFEEELQKLLEQGVVPTADERQRIQNLIDNNAGLKDQADILASIVGPQQEFERNSAALNALLESGAITAEQYRTKLAELKSQLESPAGPNALDSLIAQNEQLQLTVDQGEFVAKAVALENQLREQGVTITREVQDAIAEQLLREQSLTSELERRKKVQDDADKARQRQIQEEERAAERQQRNIERVAQSIDVNSQILEQERLINEARAQGLITQEQANQALADTQLRALEASTALEDGFARAFAKISREADNLAAVGEKVVSTFADTATDALVKFTETGQFSFKEFANAIIKDLIRIIARLLIVQALNAAFGGGAGTVAASAASSAATTSGQFANGGTTQPGRTYLVGEEGPELFTPNRTGAVTPNPGTLAAQMQPAPPVIQVVNVQSEDDIPNAIDNGSADDAIINALTRNKDRVSQVIR